MYLAERCPEMGRANIYWSCIYKLVCITSSSSLAFTCQMHVCKKTSIMSAADVLLRTSRKEKKKKTELVFRHTMGATTREVIFLIPTYTLFIAYPLQKKISYDYTKSCQR